MIAADLPRVQAMKNDLRAIRARLRLSQRAVAKAAGIESTRYWKLENDFTEPTLAEQNAVCEATGASMKEAWQQFATPLRATEGRKRGPFRSRTNRLEILGNQ
jgi:transcriptional regulator with XRE-family HTH domain